VFAETNYYSLYLLTKQTLIIMSRWKIERGMSLPQRGPKRKYEGLPLSQMERGDSVKVEEVALSKRTPTYISVRKAVRHDKIKYNLNAEFRVSTKTVGSGVCEVRVFRIR
jgi:hypothetical protein